MAATDPVTGPEPEALYSEMRVQTWSPFHYLCVAGEAPFAELDTILGPLMEALGGAVDAVQLRAIGGVVLRFAPAPAKGDKQYVMEAGYPVRAGTPPAPGTDVRAMPAFRCATLVYSGPIDAEHMTEAYNRLLSAMREAGLQSTGEGREWHLHFEGDASPNNIVMLQQGIC